MRKTGRESRVIINGKKTSCQKSFKESQKSEDELVQQNAELLAATREDKGTKTELQDCFDSGVRGGRTQNNISKGTRDLGSQRQEKERIEADKAWQVHRLATPKDKNLEMDWYSLLKMAKENWWPTSQTRHGQFLERSTKRRR